MLRHVDLCSGIGGFSLGFEWAQLSTPILFCDTEPWCRKILAKNFPNVPIATDVKELANDPERLVPSHDILTAGYPCQPFSVAGKQRGVEDDRHIWPYILRIVAQKRPTWCVFENVHGHIAMGLDQVLADLESEGYSTRTFVVPACGVNAPHKRDRLWIVAHSELAYSVSIRRGRRSSTRRGTGERNVQSEEQGRSSMGRETEGRGEPRGEDVADTTILGSQEHGHGKPDEFVHVSENVANSSGEGSQGRLSGRSNSERQSFVGQSGCSSSTYGQSGEDWWAVEPNVRRVAHGIPKRVDRIKGLGNAIVPQIAMNIGLAIKEQL